MLTQVLTLAPTTALTPTLHTDADGGTNATRETDADTDNRTDIATDADTAAAAAAAATADACTAAAAAVAACRYASLPLAPCFRISVSPWFLCPRLCVSVALSLCPDVSVSMCLWVSGSLRCTSEYTSTLTPSRFLIPRFLITLACIQNKLCIHASTNLWLQCGVKVRLLSS